MMEWNENKKDEGLLVSDAGPESPEDVGVLYKFWRGLYEELSNFPIFDARANFYLFW